MKSDINYGNNKLFSLLILIQDFSLKDTLLRFEADLLKQHCYWDLDIFYTK